MQRMPNFNGSRIGNPIYLMNKFNEFKRNFTGNPQQMVMNMLNSGQMSQQQFNQLQTMAQQLMQGMK